MQEPPYGLILSLLGDDPSPVHAAARAFCLHVIKEFYDFDYNREWHADLDALSLPAGANRYSSLHRGAFWTLAEPDGTLAATAGIHALGWRPAIVDAFRERYRDHDKVASISRVYVRKDFRGRGLGTWLNRLAENGARHLGYATIYLHASSTAAATIAFWRSLGYVEFGEDGFSTHFDKALECNAPAFD